MAIFTLRLIAALPLLLTLPAARAGQADEAVSRAARQWLEQQALAQSLQQVSIQLQLLPPRDPPPPCPTPPDAQPLDTRTPARLRFALRCSDGWSRVYGVRATLSARVPLARRDLAAGETLSTADLEWGRATLTELDVVTQPQQADGLQARAPLRRGQPLPQKRLEAPRLVRRGERVDIVAQDAGVEVRAPGEALDDGRKGETIRVRNRSSGKLVRGQVVGAAEVVAEATIAGP